MRGIGVKACVLKPAPVNMLLPADLQQKNNIFATLMFTLLSDTVKIRNVFGEISVFSE